MNAKQVYEKYGRFIDRYHGGMPAGFLAAISAHESSGNVDAVGDPRLGERGLFQITENFPKTVGVNPAVRLTAEGNTFLASLEYAIEAERMLVRHPGLIVSGSKDQWLMSRLVFALGIGAVKKLIEKVRPSTRGNMYGEIRSFVNANPGTTVSGYPASTVLKRVNGTQSLWDEGAMVVPSQTVGVPEKPPAPAGIAYQLPRGITLPSPSGALPLIAVGALALIFFAR